jgi:hypothetical protein
MARGSLPVAALTADVTEKTAKFGLEKDVTISVGHFD